MTWTCEQTEARLSDYLDGLLEPAEQAAFDHHVNGCGRCIPLVAGVSQVLTSLHRLEQVEPSTRLVDAILTVTLGPQSWRKAKRWLRGLESPRFVYGAVSVAKPKLADLAPATIYRNADSGLHRAYAHTAKFVSDLRVVYEIQSRINETDQNPAMREDTIPQSSPKKEPGRTDNSHPSSPKQQNRADELGRNLRVLACEFPTLSGALADRRVP
jgi:hypothetical protein